MTYNQALKSYQKTNVETADTLKLVIMCYDAAITDLRDAKRFHEAQSMEAAYEKIHHVQDIVTELLVGLDYEKGKDISINLSRLYNFILRQLIGINSRQNTSMYDSLAHILSELKDAWVQVREQAGMAGMATMATIAVAAPQATGRGWVAAA